MHLRKTGLRAVSLRESDWIYANSAFMPAAQFAGFGISFVWLSRAMHALYGKISRRFQSAGNTARLRCNIPFICAMRIPKFVMGTPCCIAWRSLDCSARGGSIQAPQWTTSR